MKTDEETMSPRDGSGRHLDNCFYLVWTHMDTLVMTNKESNRVDRKKPFHLPCVIRRSCIELESRRLTEAAGVADSDSRIKNAVVLLLAPFDSCG